MALEVGVDSYLYFDDILSPDDSQVPALKGEGNWEIEAAPGLTEKADLNTLVCVVSVLYTCTFTSTK